MNFATSGLSVSINVSFTGTNNGNQTLQGSPASVPASGTSTDLSTEPGSTLTFAFPASVSETGQTCSLESTSQSSPYTTDVSGSSTTITGTYTCVATPPANSAPTPGSITGTTPVDEGSTYSYADTTASDSDGDTLSYTWSVSSGNATMSGGQGTNTVSLDFTDGPSTVVLHLDISDGHGHTVSPTDLSITENNVAPTATFSNNGPVDEGSSATLSFTNPSDPSGADTAAGFHYAFDCAGGDLSGTTYAASGTSSSTTCPFADNGSYTVSGAIIDKDNGLTQYTTSVIVNNVPPAVGTLTLGGASATACIAGNGVTLDFGFTDPGVYDYPWHVDIKWGDGNHTTYDASTQGAQPQQSHNYLAGSYNVSVSVTDKDGGVGNSSGTNTVALLYNMSGILAPFNPDGSSVWKYGSTIPVKVSITDCHGTAVPGLAPQIGFSMSSSVTPTDGITETASTSAADSTGIMRFSDPIYIYNFASKNLPDGNATYYMYIRGKDSGGNVVTSPAQVSQKFGVRTK